MAGVDPTPADGPPDAGVDPPDDDGPDPLRFSRWMHRTATGAVMLGLARGLDEALAVERRPPAFVVEADRDGDDDGPIHLELDPDDPTTAVAVIRRPAVPPAGDGG